MLKNDIFLAQNGPLETDFAQRRDCLTCWICFVLFYRNQSIFFSIFDLKI